MCDSPTSASSSFQALCNSVSIVMSRKWQRWMRINHHYKYLESARLASCLISNPKMHN